MKKDLNCPVCGNLKGQPYFALCMDCSPYFYKKQGLPHQKARRRKKWIENRKILIEKVGNKCQWCDSEKNPFSIHHPKGIGARTYDYIWHAIVSDLIKKFIEQDSPLAELVESRVKVEQKRTLKKKLKARKEKAKNTMVETCPYCKSSNCHQRKTITPRYKCSSCQKEFDATKKRYPNNLARSIKNLEMKLKTQDYSYTPISPSKTLGPMLPFIYDEARKTYDENVKQLVSNYEEMEDVIVLCKKCHSAARMGLVICRKCKTNYHRTENKTCYQCKTGEKWEDRRKKIEEAWNQWYEGDDDDDWEELE